MDRRGVIGVLGPIEILAPAHLTIRSVRKRAVLAGLALDAGREITVDRLIDLVWGAAPPRTAHHALQVYISELRAQIGDVGAGLVTTSTGYRLELAVVTTDIAVVDELVGAGRAAAALGRFDEAVEMFTDALARWRGEPFEGFDDVDEIRAGRARLDALRAGLRDELADAYLALGRHAELIPHLESRVVAEPLRERPYEHLMVALYRSGRQSEALRVYQRARDVLLEHVGVEPGSRLREIEAAVLRQDDEVLGLPELDPIAKRSPEARPFVGRAVEFDRLAELADDVEHAGAGRVVLVGGEPGIGKTRLVEEVVDRLGARGWTVLQGRSPDERGAPPLWPVAEALLLAGGAGAAVDFDLEAVAPLLRLMRGDATFSSTDARLEGPSSFALHDAVADVMLGAAPDRTVLIIDDVHWADEATLGVLVRLAQRGVPAPLLVLVTHRVADIDRSDEFDRALARLVREPSVTRLTVGPIDAVAELAYIEALGAVLSPDEVGWIRARSDGNPLFLTELVRLVEARHESTESSLPSGLEQVLDARLTLLGESADVLSRAAVIGREFDVGVLARLGVDTGESISRALAAGGRGQLIGQRSVGVWRFSHALVAEAAADRLDDDGRRRLHLRVAEVLDLSPVGDRTRRTAEVARHRVAALPIGDPALAAEACLRSGDDALAAFAYDDAANAYRTARSALAYGHAGDRMLLRALVGEAEALTAAGDSAAARPLLDEALDLVDREHDPQLFALAVRVLALHRSTASAQGDERLSSLLRDAIDALGDECGWLGVQLRTDLAMLHYRTDRHGVSEALARQALDIATESGDVLATSFALTGLHQAIWSPSTLDERMHIATEAIATARTIGLSWQESMATTFRAADGWERGDFGAVERDLASATELAARGRRPRFVWITRSWSALLDLYRGDVESAQGGFAEALAAWGPEPNPDAVQCFFAQQLVLRLLDGTVTDIIDLLREIAATDPDVTLWQALLSYPLVLAGVPDEANCALDGVMSTGVDRLHHDVTHHTALAMLSEAAGALGRSDVASAVTPLLEPFANRRIVTNVYGGGGLCWGSVAHQLGVCAATTGEVGAARHWYEVALEHHRNDGAVPFVARTRARLAELALPAPR